MAYDERLSSLAQKMGDYYYDDEKYSEYWAAYLDRLAVVAVTRGDSVIEMELPMDSVMSFIYDGDFEFVEKILPEFKQMIEVLESVNYSRVNEWKSDYEEAVRTYNEAKIDAE